MVLLDGKKGAVTERDERVCRDIFRARYLSTPQLHRLHFGSESRTKMRLGRLTEKGWVRNMVFYDDLGRRRTCWRLTKDGFESQAASLNLDDETWTPKQLGPEKIRHYIQTNEVYTALKTPFNKDKSLDEILGPYPHWEWLNEQRASDSFEYANESFDHQPDAEVWFAGKLFIIERQTTESRVKTEDIYDKVKGHRSYALYGADLELSDAEVLFACDDQRIADTARRAGEHHKLSVVADSSEKIASHIRSRASEVVEQIKRSTNSSRQ